MAKISLAKCLSSMNSPASQQLHNHRQQQQMQQQHQQETSDEQQWQQPTGEKLVEFSHNFINRHMLQHHNSYNVLTENNTKFSCAKKWYTSIVAENRTQQNNGAKMEKKKNKRIENEWENEQQACTHNLFIQMKMYRIIDVIGQDIYDVDRITATQCKWPICMAWDLHLLECLSSLVLLCCNLLVSCPNHLREMHFGQAKRKIPLNRVHDANSTRKHIEIKSEKKNQPTKNECAFETIRRNSNTKRK